MCRKSVECEYVRHRERLLNIRGRGVNANEQIASNVVSLGEICYLKPQSEE